MVNYDCTPEKRKRMNLCLYQCLFEWSFLSSGLPSIEKKTRVCSAKLLCNSQYFRLNTAWRIDTLNIFWTKTSAGGNPQKPTKPDGNDTTILSQHLCHFANYVHHKTSYMHLNLFTPAKCSGRFKGCKCTPLWQVVMYVHICTSPSNDYAAVACSNNNQAQLHTHISVPYWSPDVCLGLELLRNIQFGLPAVLNNSLASFDNNFVCSECIYVTGSRRGNPKNFSWTPLSISATEMNA